MWRNRSIVLAAVALCAASGDVLATDYTELAGGSGGSAFNLDCGANMSLVGIQGKAGSMVDSVQGVCAQINADGSKLGGNKLTGKAGGAGGDSYHLQCLGGSTIKGIKGHVGAYVNELTAHCSATTPEFTGSVGRANGTWFNRSCPANMDARLIRGRAGSWIDAIGLGCKTAQRLKVDTVSIPSSVRVGQTAPLTVTMSMVPVESVSVHLGSSNVRLTPMPGSVTVGTSTTKASANVAASETGCARVTASYKGSSAWADLVVHGPASPGLVVTGPTTIRRYGPAASFTVSIPSAEPQYTSVQLSVRGPQTLLGPAVYLPSELVNFAPGKVSATFQVLPRTLGCALIHASISKVGVPSVIHAVMVIE